EVELVLAVPRIERSGGGARGEGDERGRVLRTVVQHHRHPVAAADPHRIHIVDGARGEVAQAAPAEGFHLRRAERRGGVLPAGELRKDGLRIVHAFASSTDPPSPPGFEAGPFSETVRTTGGCATSQSPARGWYPSVARAARPQRMPPKWKRRS